MSFSVFSCRTIINSSPRRERMRYSRGGCRAPASKPPPFFAPLGPDGWSGHLDHCTGPRGASMEPPPPGRPLVDGNTSSAHVIRKQKPVGSSRAGRRREAAAASLQLQRILLHLSSATTTGSCLESCAALPPLPPSRRSIGKAVSVSHTAPLL